MEHLSRRTTRDVQHLLVVSDPTQRGIVAAERIAGFRNELDIRIENTYLVLNRLPVGDGRSENEKLGGTFSGEDAFDELAGSRRHPRCAAGTHRPDGYPATGCDPC